MVSGIKDSCTRHYGCTKDGGDRSSGGQGWLRGGGDTAVVRRVSQATAISGRGTKESKVWRLEAEAVCRFAVPGAQRGGEEAGAEDWEQLTEGLMCHVKTLGPLFMRIL